ncbi:expansin-B4-like [Sesamum indicum]|uniref:Expansin-B4-like n=1 Tax=Sesamum indicum TaxID=4182 RepID=A0A6I9T246_SESIN|nr:expansin-B4-like [Sesamum indicum]
MSNYRSYRFGTILVILLIVSDYYLCVNSESINASVLGFAPAIATWYGDPIGPGSVGGACGYGRDVENPPYYALVSAGNNNLFKSGKGCGSCYQVKCTQNAACSGNPVTVTIADECPGSCNNDPIHFDLSGKAIGVLAKPGQANALRSAGRINIEYQRVPCYYKGTSITFKIDPGSNANYLAFGVQYINGDGEIGSMQLLPSNSKNPLVMQQVFGATWKANIPNGIKGPYSVAITSLESRKTVTAYNSIPVDWSPGKYYISKVNF